MLKVHAIKIQDPSALASSQRSAAAPQLLDHSTEQNSHVTDRIKRSAGDAHAKEVLPSDEGNLQAGIGATADAPAKDANEKRRPPKQQKLPEHLPRVETRIEPKNTHCPSPECGQPMVRVGEDICEWLDIVPARFFVQRHIRGKWFCPCCKVLVQEGAAPHVFDNALPSPGLRAHTVIRRFVHHLPYYRQEHINARSGVNTPRTALAAWTGQTGVQVTPLFEAHRDFVLSCSVLQVDETPVSLLDPGTGKTRKAYMWGYARGTFDAQPGVVYDFCLGRGGEYACAFLKGWNGTLLVDAYADSDDLLAQPGRTTAHCLAHVRRKFEELNSANPNEVIALALQRITWLYRIESDIRHLDCAQRLKIRQLRSQLLWDELHTWLQLERTRVPDGGATAKALDYSLKHWKELSRFLHDGAVPIDNSYIEDQIRPWALGRRSWMFVSGERAGERAAMVVSLLQSVKLRGHDPWTYLKDVLTRLPTQPDSRIEELLPHCWQPPEP